VKGETTGGFRHICIFSAFHARGGAIWLAWENSFDALLRE